jgi:mannose-1-phosphate guanylyltransferase/phosphomannomutase
MGIEELGKEYGVEVIRVANDHRAMMEALNKGKAEFVGGTRGGFIFPGFQMGSDAILGTVKILELLAKTRTRLGQLRKKHELFVRQAVSVPCPWAKKGTVMRRLIVGSDGKQRQLIDGVRIFESGGWVLIAPDRFHASFNVSAESRSREETDHLITHYREFVLDSQTN